MATATKENGMSKQMVLDAPAAKRVEAIAPSPAQDITPLTLLQSAIDKGVDVGNLERLMALQERWQENVSKERFASALAAFQRDMPRIHKGRKTDRFHFAGFDDIMAQASPILAAHGITIGFDTQHADNNRLTVSCRIRVGSYHEDRMLTIPVPASLKVSEPQQYGAALSYAKRYCLCAALNIVVTDEDRESIVGAMQQATAEQVSEVGALLKETDSDVERFMAWLGIDSLAQMSVQQYERAMRALKSKMSKGAAK